MGMLYGRDEQALAAIGLGADACVSSTVQYSQTLRDVVRFDQTNQRELARAAQDKNAHLCSFFGQYDKGAYNVQKNIMGMIDMDVGPSRLPKRDLSEADYSLLQKQLQSFDLIDTTTTTTTIHPTINI